MSSQTENNLMSGDPFNMAESDPLVDIAEEDFNSTGATEIQIDGTEFEVETR
jgi:hypothetical protein